MWRSIQVNKQNIKRETGKAVLIACPHNSDYDGYCFWHSAKLIRDGKHSNAVSISYTEEFTFCLKKYGKGGNILNEVELGYDEIEEVFGVMNENITAKQFKSDYETHKPAKVAAVKVEVDESLIDD